MTVIKWYRKTITRRVIRSKLSVSVRRLKIMMTKKTASMVACTLKLNVQDKPKKSHSPISFSVTVQQTC